jgi:hypothetical protein
MWFKRMGDARLEACATEGCGQAAIWRLEAGGTGSNYCSACKERIGELFDEPAEVTIRRQRDEEWRS